MFCSFGLCDCVHYYYRPLVTKKLREVGLLEKEHTPSMSLSGGQKRKLSVALALTGSPTLCILDEPTSGDTRFASHFAALLATKYLLLYHADLWDPSMDRHLQACMHPARRLCVVLSVQALLCT